MGPGSRKVRTLARGVAWAVLGLMLAAALYSAWILAVNYERIRV